MSAASDIDAVDAAAPLLTVRGLQTFFPTDDGTIRAVDGVDIDVHAGECLGVVGESGIRQERDLRQRHGACSQAGKDRRRLDPFRRP